jgi:hypothetical protein
MISKKGNVRLYSTSVLYRGKVTETPISLVYETKGSKPLHVDINSLRPDPAVELSPGKKYAATLEFDSILLPSGHVEVLRTFSVDSGNLKFVNIR